MISVSEAESLVLGQVTGFGRETIGSESSAGRVLAEPVVADRDYPPHDKSTMDGIAISYASFAKGRRQFTIGGIQPAGAPPLGLAAKAEAVKIMTGAVLPKPLDTVIPKEELSIAGPTAAVAADKVVRGQFVHIKGADVPEGKVVVPAGSVVVPKLMPILASVGQTQVVVSKLPKVAIVTTGDELVDAGVQPTDYQTRRSNDSAMRAVLARYGCVADAFHLPDEKKATSRLLKKCLQAYDCVLISGGVSAGDFDYVQVVLAELSVTKIFHGVAQKPGKPFWFGKHAGGAVVFAFPGNPVSMYVCLTRYFVPWLRGCLGAADEPALYAALDGKVHSKIGTTMFVQATVRSDKHGRLWATPLAHHGSGDFISLAGADALIEVPPDKATAVCRAWPLQGV